MMKIYRTIILPVVLCACESLSHISRRRQADSVAEQGAAEDIAI
jgi:hypothetical protein